MEDDGRPSVEEENSRPEVVSGTSLVTSPLVTRTGVSRGVEVGRFLLVTSTGVSSGLEEGRLMVAGTRVLLVVGSLSVSAVSLVVRGSS